MTTRRHILAIAASVVGVAVTYCAGYSRTLTWYEAVLFLSIVASAVASVWSDRAWAHPVRRAVTPFLIIVYFVVNSWRRSGLNDPFTIAGIAILVVAVLWVSKAASELVRPET
jgi:hypothetical protein